MKNQAPLYDRQLLLLGAFFAWRYGAAFGERRDPIETSSRRFVEHVRVLGACYERARATRHRSASRTSAIARSTRWR